MTLVTYAIFFASNRQREEREEREEGEGEEKRVNAELTRVKNRANIGVFTGSARARAPL